MGFFDVFRRNQSSDQVQDEQVSSQLREPRCHHYNLAHIALRSAAFQNPTGFIDALTPNNAADFVAMLMEFVVEDCQEESPDFSVDELRFHYAQIDKYPCTIVELPTPVATAEAFFVAGVLLVEPDDGVAEPTDVTLRYFTLEKGFLQGGGERTVLCEWTADGSHANYGDGPEPEVAEFEKTLKMFLANEETTCG